MAKPIITSPNKPIVNNITGGDGDDILNGGSGKDNISSGKGSDIINAGAGDDVVLAGAGDDVIIHNINENKGFKDSYDGGTGSDTLQLVMTQEQYGIMQKALADFSTWDKSQPFDFSRYNKDFNFKVVNIEHITFEILPPTIQFQSTQSTTTDKDDTLTGTGLNDMLVGGPGNDKLIGMAGNDRLIGGSGNDHLIGGAGNDDLIGGAGNDCMNAGAGNDVINGSAGADKVIHFVDENQGFHDYYQDSGTSVQNDGQDKLVLVFSDSDYAKMASLITTMQSEFAAAKKNGVVFDFSKYNTALENLGVHKTLTIGTKGFETLEIINATKAQHRANYGDECYGSPNQAPVVGTDSFVKTEDSAFNDPNHTTTLGNKLANDTDPDGDTLHLVSLQNVHINASAPFSTMTATLVDGSFTDGNGATVLLTMGGQTATINIDLLGNETLSDPNHLFNGLDTNESLIITADYTVTDGQLNSTGSQSITITGINDVPVAVNDAYTTAEDTPLTVIPAGILINDTDIDNDPLTSILNVGPAHGSLSLAADGSFVYTPDANFNGTDTFTYHANDGTADSNIATVTITIEPVNDAPVAVNDAYTTDEDTQLTITPAGILMNDSDIDNDPLTSILNVGPAHGSLSLAADGSFVYTPDADYNGTDTFTYHANDGTANSNIATVTITINPVNELLIAAPDNDILVNEAALDKFQDGADLAAGTRTGTNPASTAETDNTGNSLASSISGGSGVVTFTLVGGVVGAGFTTMAGTNGTLKLFSDGTYLYTLTSPVIGPLADNGTNTEVRESFTYRADDADGQHATSTISVSIVDDVPIANVTNGIAQNSTNTTVNGTLVNMGADTDGAHVVLSLGSMPTGLTSNGTAITYTVSPDGHIITAKAGLNTVFDLTANPDGTYVFHQSAMIDLTVLTSNLQSSVGAGGPQSAYYFYTNGQFGSMENAANWAVKITSNGNVNPSTQGMGVDNNLFQKTNSAAETLKFEFDDEHASTVGGTTPNLAYIAKIGVTGFDVGETLTYTAYYIDGTNSGAHTITSANLVSGSFTIQSPANTFLDYIDLAAGPTDTSVRLNSFTTFVQDDTKTQTLNFNYKAIDGDGDSKSGTFSILETNASALTGTASNDAIGGGFGNNVIMGTGGNDILTGGLGNDVITGGSGNDAFVFSLINNGGNMQMQGNDTITDLALGDKLQFQGVLDVVGGGNGSDIADLNAQTIFSDTGPGNANLSITFAGGGSMVLNGLGNHSITDFTLLNAFLPGAVVVA